MPEAQNNAQADTQADNPPPPLDLEAWKRELYDLNPWAEGLEPEAVLPGDWRRKVNHYLFLNEFAQKRLQAALKRCWVESKEGEAAEKAWNEWAEPMLALRGKLEAAELWAKDNNKATAEQQLFLQCASVEFDGLCLRGGADFAKFIFPGHVSFRQAQFGDKEASRGGAQFSSGSALFHGAQFSGGGARFHGAQFSGGGALFHGAQFSGGDAWFHGAQFGAPDKTTPGFAGFEETMFRGSANFTRCQINYPITFAHARFEGPATFEGAHSKIGFTLNDAVFDRVPDFTQTNFHRELRLDNVKVHATWLGTVLGYITPKQRSSMSWLQYFRHKWIERDRNAPAKFREFKQFAIQAQDSSSELNFHAEEIRSARWVTDWPWHARFWFGYFYSMLSRFGRSLWRPALFWAVTTAIFTCIYLAAHLDHAAKTKNADLVTYTVEATSLTGRAWWDGLPCTQGNSNDIIGLKQGVLHGTNALSQAVRLSIANAVDFGGLRGAEGVRLSYGCLYGLERIGPLNSEDPGAARGIPYLPPGIAWAMGIQKVFSALFIFLFGLALRNMLKLK